MHLSSGESSADSGTESESSRGRSGIKDVKKRNVKTCEKLSKIVDKNACEIGKPISTKTDHFKKKCIIHYYFQ